jgi:hypothetical protein
MIRLTIHVTYSRRSLVACASALACLLAAGLAASLMGRSRAQSSPEVVTYLPQGAARHVYLTEGNYYPDEALQACGPGYHMASLWEIADTSNWVYDHDHPAAHVQGDSGYGPPSHWYGWIRTGYWSSGDSITGTGNCQNWTSDSGGDKGTLVRLSRWWEAAPGEILTWFAYPCPCNEVAAVWCVADVKALYLPLVLKSYR